MNNLDELVESIRALQLRAEALRWRLEAHGRAIAEARARLNMELRKAGRRLTTPEPLRPVRPVAP